MTTLLAFGAAAPEICRGWLQVGIGVLVQCTLLLGLGLAAGRLLSARGPAFQSWVYRATIGAVAISALASVLLVGSVPALWSVSLPPAHATEIGARVATVAAARAMETARPAAAETPAPAAPATLSRSSSAPAGHISEPGTAGIGWVYVGVVGVWLGGSALLLAWLGLCHLHIRRLRQRSAVIRDGEAADLLRVVSGNLRLRPPLLLANGRVQSPFLTGLWRPAILLPAGYESEFDGLALRAILIHEMTHVARWDCAWNLLARTLCAVLWVQPLLWALARRLEHAGEEVCDQRVLELENNAHAYADCLLRLAERLMPSRPERAAGMGVVPFRSSLARRVEQILDGSRRQTLALAWRWRVAIALGAAGAVALGLSLVSAAATRPGGGRRALQPINAGEPPPGGPVSGQVLTPEGHPAPGATVAWITHTDDGPVVLTSVKTDAAGQFRFEDTARLRHRNDYPQLLAEAAGAALSLRNLPEGSHTVDITLEPATGVRITFLDPDGKPVPNLKVLPELVAREREVIFLPEAIRQGLARQTDANGTVRLEGLPRGFRLRLDILDARFAHLSDRDSVNLGNGPESEGRSIHLMPGASLQGRVTFGPTGRPAAGIKVGAQGMDPGEGWGDAVTDANGEYHLTQLRPGAFNVALDLRAEVARSWTARAHEGVYVALGERLTGIDFSLIQGAVVTGKVTAADTGEPLSGLAVGVYGPAHPQSGAWVQRTVTGADGTYLHRVPGGKQHVYFQDLPPAGFLKPARDSYDLTVKDGDTVTVDFKLPRGARVKPIRGRVLGPDGKPVPNAEVVVASSSRFGTDTSLQTDTDGTFILSEQLLSNTLTLRARRGDLATPEGTVVAGRGPVTLRLQPRVFASLSGRVTDTTGRPIPGAEVSLSAWTYDTGAGSGTVHTDPQGRFALSSLWPDLRYTVNATAKGFGQKWTEQMRLRPAESREIEPLVLRIADRSAAGRVVDENGDPVVGVPVYLDGRDTAQQMNSTDAEGRFHFDTVVDEKVTLGASRPGYQWAHKSVPAGSTDVVLVLTPENGTKSADDGAKLDEQYARLQGRPAPELRAVAWVNSPPRSLAQLRGKVVLIDFWGIGCGPCVAALPGVQRAAVQFSGRGVVVIGLHPGGTSTAEMRKFAQQHHLTYPLAIDAVDGQNLSFGKTFREYTVVGIPSVAVIDRSGKVAYLGHSLDDAIGSLAPLLANASRVVGRKAS